jgi:hypothetical protein
MILRWLLVASLLMSLLLAGCGGITIGGPAPLAEAVYSGNYKAGTGSVVVALLSSSEVEVTVTDKTRGVFSGKGSINADLEFDLTFRRGSSTVRAVGDLDGKNTGSRFEVPLSGTISETVSGRHVSDGRRSWFDRGYDGIFDDPVMDWVFILDVQGDGDIEGTLTNNTVTPPQTYTLEGEITASGLVTFEVMGEAWNFEFVGSLYYDGSDFEGQGEWEGDSSPTGPDSGDWLAFED